MSENYSRIRVRDRKIWVEVEAMGLFRPLRLRYIWQLRRNQWLKEEELIRIQETRLQAIISHAYHNVAFYREMFDSVGIKPGEIRNTYDLRKIPIITKEEVQKNYSKMIAEGVDINRCKIQSTTGSTGMPLKVCYGRKLTNYSLAVLDYVFFECGLRLVDKLVEFCVPVDTVPNSQRRMSIMLKKLGMFNMARKLKRLIARKQYISMLEPIETNIETLREIRPDVIYGFPSILLLLANKIEADSISGIKPRLIIAHGETLTDYSRKKIGDIFDAEVYHTYGSAEFSGLAFECKEHSGYHMISDSAIIEFIKDGRNVGPGEPAEIVVTGLHNYEMPLIRYNMRDVGIPSGKRCNCGRSLPLMSSVEGRIDDFLVLPSGRVISPRAINVIEYVPGVVEYRTVQEEKDRFLVWLVKGKGFSERTIEQIKEQIQAGCLGEDVKVEVKLVKEIPKERTGKLRVVVSKVGGV